LYFKYNREQVFCILGLRVEVFDKSISNTFLKSILYFVFKYFKKVSFTTLGNPEIEPLAGASERQGTTVSEMNGAILVEKRKGR